MRNLPPIKFKNIRPHQGTQYGGFEELCVQLFRADVANGLEVIRIEGSGGDGGVEAFVPLKNGKEIGLQAKFFDRLQPKQWQQIAKSVKSALANHPKLIEYRIAIPLNRTTDQKTKWDAAVKEWHAIAKQEGLRQKITFVWWGASELEDLLTTSSHKEKILYWFGCHQFSDEWLDRHNNTTVKDLDCRYTPKHHIQTESEARLNAFTLTDSFIADFYSHAKKVVDASRQLCDTIRGEKLRQHAQSECKTFTDAFISASGRFGDGKTTPPYENVRESCRILRERGETLLLRIKDLNRPAESDRNHEQRMWHQGPFEYEVYLARQFLGEICDYEDFLNRFACADVRKTLVIGPAGSGKSHLLAAAVLEARKRGQAALILLGEYFLSNDDPWTQLLTTLGWDGTVTEFLSALNHSAEIFGRPALLCIDALNESSERNLWHSHLNSFADQIEPYSHIRLLVSCRSDFAPLTLPDILAKGSDASWATIEHMGFGEEIFEAVSTYFSDYGIQADHFPPLIEEFQNPLFLKTFCEAFENTRLPKGPITLVMVMEKRMSNLCKKLMRDLDCPEEVTRKAIETIAKAIEQNSGYAVPKAEVRPKIDELLPARGESQSLYRHLKSNGMLVEVGDVYYKSSNEPKICVRFPYERFSEYFMAERMLQSYKEVKELKAGWTKDGTLKRINDPVEFWKLRGLMRALSILLPERFGIELAGLVQSRDLKRDVYEDFLASLPWRSPASFNQRSQEVFRLAQALGLRTFLEALLRVSSIPAHPYNADYLHSQLRKMKLPVREQVWTVELSKLTIWGDGTPDLLVKWAFRVPLELVSDEQVLLVARVLAWFFSSNHKAFRLRATLAAIRLLEGRSDLAVRLVEDFHDCNDPYVVERVFAVACGVAMREKDNVALQRLAAVVYNKNFAGDAVPPHILQRDYAQCVLEVAHHRSCLPEGISPEKYRPPYSSNWLRIWSEAQVAPLEKDKEWFQITFSVKPESMGMYGDFGRYVMQYKVQQFLSVPLKRKLRQSQYRGVFSAKTARRWILQRVKQLGWTPARFGQYESDLPWRGRQRVDIEERRAERISKKYQWIALRELQGYLSDHYHLKPDWGDEQPQLFEGAWQLGSRDFDPSQPLRDVSDDGDEDSNGRSTKNICWWNNYPDPFADEQLSSNRQAWVIAPPADFKPLIDLPPNPTDHKEYLSLAGYFDWEEDLPYHASERDLGRLKMWVHIKSWLVRREHLRKLLAKISDMHFWGVGSDLVHFGKGWIGEYPWGGTHKDTGAFCAEQDAWIREVDIPVIQAVCQYERDGILGIIPSPQLCEIMGIKWAGKDFEFEDNSGAVLVFSPYLSRRENAPSMIVRAKLINALRKSGFEIVWVLLGERMCFSIKAMRHIVPKEVQFSGVFHLSEGKVAGRLTKHIILKIPHDAR